MEESVVDYELDTENVYMELELDWLKIIVSINVIRCLRNEREKNA